MNRYSRQTLFGPIGEEGQNKLSNSSVLIVGMGALGTVIASHLTRSGIGRIRIVDRDFVEESNLQRQSLFTEQDAKDMVPKAIAAKNILESYNSEIIIEAHVSHISQDNIQIYMEGIDIVFDGTDNFSTRYILNDSCFKNNIPFLYGGVVSSRGMTAFLNPASTSCLRCLFEEQQSSGQTCDTVGVISPIVDIIGSIQVTEGLKYLTGHASKIQPILRTFDIWNNQTYHLKLPPKRSDCPVCMHHVYPSLNQGKKDLEQSLCGRNSVQIIAPINFDLDEMEKRLKKIAPTKRTPFLLRVELNHEVTFVLFPNGRVMIQGTDDLSKARSLFDRYIGS